MLHSGRFRRGISTIIDTEVTSTPNRGGFCRLSGSCGPLEIRGYVSAASNFSHRSRSRAPSKLNLPSRCIGGRAALCPREFEYKTTVIQILAALARIGEGRRIECVSVGLNLPCNELETKEGNCRKGNFYRWNDNVVVSRSFIARFRCFGA